MDKKEELHKKYAKYIVNNLGDLKVRLPHFALTDNGDLVFLRNKIWGITNYAIEKERLSEKDWVSHMMEKMPDFKGDKVSFLELVGEFFVGYFAALRNAGIRELEVDLYAFEPSMVQFEEMSDEDINRTI